VRSGQWVSARRIARNGRWHFHPCLSAKMDARAKPSCITTRINVLSSIDQAILFFNKWAQNRTRLNFLFTGGVLNFALDVVVLPFSGNFVVSALPAAWDVNSDRKPGGFVTFDLTAVALFKFLDLKDEAKTPEDASGLPAGISWSFVFADSTKLDVHELES
jgi:hypothetical protein